MFAIKSVIVFSLSCRSISHKSCATSCHESLPFWTAHSVSRREGGGTFSQIWPQRFLRNRLKHRQKRRENIFFIYTNSKTDVHPSQTLWSRAKIVERQNIRCCSHVFFFCWYPRNKCQNAVSKKIRLWGLGFSIDFVSFATLASVREKYKTQNKRKTTVVRD